MFENSKLSRYKVRKIIECVCIDIDATKTALLLKLNRKTVNRYFLAFRRLIYLHQVSQKEQIVGVVEVEERFFGPVRVRGRPGPKKRCRGTRKQPVFGIYERNGAVYTELITDCGQRYTASLACLLFPHNRIVFNQQNSIGMKEKPPRQARGFSNILTGLSMP